MPIPIVYRKSGENVLATYDYVDLAEGTGTVQYYGMRGETISGSNIFYSINKGLTYYDGVNGGILRNDEGIVNFDMTPFNFPKIIKGNLYISCDYVGATSGVIEFTIQKISKGTAINLAEKDWTRSVAAETQFLLKFEIPETLFKVGDNLRIAVQIIGGTGNEGLCINNEHATYKPFKIYIPYKIDL